MIFESLSRSENSLARRRWQSVSLIVATGMRRGGNAGTIGQAAGVAAVLVAPFAPPLTVALAAVSSAASAYAAGRRREVAMLLVQLLMDLSQARTVSSN